MCRTVQWYLVWRCVVKHPMKTQNKMARRIFMHVYYMWSSEMILRLFHTECVHHVMLAVALLVQDYWVGFATIWHCSGSRQTQTVTVRLGHCDVKLETGCRYVRAVSLSCGEDETQASVPQFTPLPFSRCGPSATCTALQRCRAQTYIYLVLLEFYKGIFFGGKQH